MKKIPTIFERDWAGDKSKVLPKPTEAHALLEGATATRKYDGTACLLRDNMLFKRYDCKKGKTAPTGFEPCGDADPETGHQPGWIPVTDRPDDKWHMEAIALGMDYFHNPFENGTYELVGPKVQGNPENVASSWLIPHGKTILANVPTDFEGVKAFLAANEIEGIVWWKNGQPIAKIKRRDFGLQWPVKR